MADNLKLKIADIVFSLIFKKGEFKLQQSPSYRSFLTQDSPGVTLHFQRCSDSRKGKGFSGEVIFDTQSNWRLKYHNSDYILETRDRAMIFSSDFTHGEVYIITDTVDFPFTYPLDEIFMINLLARARGILMHACGVIEKGRGVLFCGNSGAGKSTMANLWKGHKQSTILSDDRIIIRKRDKTFWIYGTPWHGDARVCSPQRAPLEKIFFLKHSSRNIIKEIGPDEAVLRLIRCSFPTFWDKQGMGFTLDLCSELVKEIPCYELGFLPDKGILKMLGDAPPTGTPICSNPNK